jgi:NUMOD3 motif
MSGFVYVWFDRKKKRYYVGSHWGSEDDGYICSSTWMKRAYFRRPQDFKRKIIKKIFTNKGDMFSEEQRYLDMIKPEERKIRYYNINLKWQHWSNNPNIALSVKEKISNSQKGNKYCLGRKLSKETKKKMSLSHKGCKLSEEHKKKIGLKSKGRIPWNKGCKLSKEQKKKMGLNAPWNKGLKGVYKQSEETKKKHSESAIKQWQRQKTINKTKT